MDRILITGASGFVGRHLLNALKGSDAGIFGIGADVCQKLPGLLDYSQVDMKDAKALSEYAANVKPTHVYHLAAISNVRASFEKIRETFLENIVTTTNLMDALGRLGSSVRILVISSGTMYRHEAVVTESTSVEPANPYASSKRCCELIALEYGRQNKNLQVVIARPLNHFGPGQRGGFVIPDFCSQIAEIEMGLRSPAIETGNIEVWRDLTDVRDIVRAYMLCMQKADAGQIYNIASGKSVTIKQVLETLLSLSKVKISHKTSAHLQRVEDTAKMSYSTEKIHSKTGWEPLMDFNTSLKETLEWWRGNYGAFKQSAD